MVVKLQGVRVLRPAWAVPNFPLWHHRHGGEWGPVADLGREGEFLRCRTYFHGVSYTPWS
jgi:hypothetical protein